MLDKKSFTIGILCLSAVMLVVANILAPHESVAALTVSDNDFTLQTAKSLQGGDAVYVTDLRTGVMGCFVYSPAAKGLVLTAKEPVQDAFAKALAKH